MDDQNKTNQPLDQSAPQVPLQPPVQPVPQPMTEAPESLPPTPQPAMTAPAVEQTISSTPPVFNQETAVAAPQIDQVEPTLVSSPSPSAMEPPMPEVKSKKKAFSVLMGVAALLLVVGVAGAAYYVSNQLSTRQAVAPTAPESKPMAASTPTVTPKPTPPCSGFSSSSSCPSSYCKWVSRCSKCGNSSASDTTICGSTPTPPKATATATVAPTASVCNLGTNCSKYSSMPPGCSRCQCGSNWVIIGSCSAGAPHPSCASACGSPTSNPTTNPSQTPTGSCTKDGTFQNGTVKCDYVNNIGNTTPAGASCDSDNWSNKSCTAYSYNCGRYCFLASCGAAACNSQPTGTTPPSNTCDSTKRDAPASNEITFAKAGKIIPFMRNPYTGTITLSKTGSSDIVIPFIKGNAVELTSFSVKAGDKYTIKTRISTESKNAYGWIPNKSTNLCGPVKTPGDPLDGNSKPTGKCGEEVDIKAVRTLAESKVDFAGITASGKSASIQCWGDAALGDSTQDYDYNDFTIIFGYEKSTEVGACVNMKIYKKVADVYSSTALTVAQLQTLKVGDVLKFTVDGSIVGLKGRFRVTIDDVPGEWLTPTISSNGTMNIYTDYAVAKAGTYKFEAQVSTTP